MGMVIAVVTTSLPEACQRRTSGCKEQEMAGIPEPDYVHHLD
jgi:hypothetical protein